MSTQRRDLFFEFVKRKHGPQIRKYTGEPYWEHLLAVANNFAPYCTREGEIEAAFGHDLYEDTDCTATELFEHMSFLGYPLQVIEYTDSLIRDLTDQYTKESYPQFNRYERKKLEAKRLSIIQAPAQSIKYCDIIDNTKSIIEHDEKFAVVYLREKSDIMVGMVSGNATLRDLCLRTLEEARMTKPR